MQTRRVAGKFYAIVRPDGRISQHRNRSLAGKAWRYGDAMYMWWRGEWRFWTPAGLL